MTRRPLTEGERALAASVFGKAIDYSRVTVNNRKWWPFQPQRVTMAPDGHLWFHPQGGRYCEDFACADLSAQGLFIHEMTHVAQAAHGGRWYLPLMRHPFCRYDYEIEAGKPFHRYGIEQQAEIVRHAFLMRQGAVLAEKPPLDVYEALLPYNR
ncbi:vgr related protein [Sphingomonas colocasiae]|uniref:Vgr related protein n=1 Tax=Sphingomonas colocasiae TaxID=1848973 RepID=A0ABS7PN81_9SPHN|nr:vgr related protein [Sphingomonas colocasiae]MBY8822691.1 vgr related protein [Sphingomonas colocasiae]